MTYEILVYIRGKTERGLSVSPKELSERFELAQSTISYHLDKLTQEGSIIRNGAKITAVEHGGLIDVVRNSIGLPEALLFPVDNPRYVVLDLQEDAEARTVMSKYRKLKEALHGTR